MISSYLDIYLTIDLLLLEVIFLDWRKFGMDNFGLDMSLSYSLPSYTMQIWLYQSRPNIDLIGDFKILRLFELAKRGGFSGSLGIRFAEANTPSIPQLYRPDERTMELLDLDVVSLYSFILGQAHPCRKFRELSNECCLRLTKYFQ